MTHPVCNPNVASFNFFCLPWSTIKSVDVNSTTKDGLGKYHDDDEDWEYSPWSHRHMIWLSSFYFDWSLEYEKAFLKKGVLFAYNWPLTQSCDNCGLVQAWSGQVSTLFRNFWRNTLFGDTGEINQRFKREE